MPQFTLADLEQSVYDNVDNNSLFYPQSEVDAVVNEAVRTLNLHVGFMQTRVAVTGGTQANRVWYDVPPGILFPLAVYHRGRPLNRSSIRGVASLDRNWTRARSVNIGPPRAWIPAGIRKFAIYPADSVAANTLEVDGVAEPTALTSPSQVLNVPDEYTPALEDLGAHLLQLKEGGKIFADASASYQSFLRLMHDMTIWQEAKHPRYWVEEKSEKVA